MYLNTGDVWEAALTFLKQGVSCLTPTRWFPQTTSPFAFLFLTVLRWIFTLHSLPPTSTSPLVQAFFFVHFSPPCLALPGFLPAWRLLKLNRGGRSLRLARTNAFPWDLSLFFHTSVSKDVPAVLFTAKHQPSSRICPPFFNDIMFLYTFCGKEQHVTW